MKGKYFPLILFFLFFMYAKASENLYSSCYKLFEEKKYSASYQCFEQISDNSIYYPHALYYKIIIKIKQGVAKPSDFDELLNYRNYALTHYALYSGIRYFKRKGDYETVLKLSDIADYRALLEEEAPVLLTMKRDIYKYYGQIDKVRDVERILSTEYITSPPGFRIFMKNINKYTDKEKLVVIRKFLKGHRYMDVLRIASTLENKSKKFYYLAVANIKLRRYKTAWKYIEYFNPKSDTYGELVYKLFKRKKRYGIKYIKYLYKVGNSRYASKIALDLMTSNFYKRKYLKTIRYASFVRHPDYLSEKYFLLGLLEYKNNNIEEAIDRFKTALKYKNKDKSKIYYWLHLSYKVLLEDDLSRYYLIKAASFNNPYSFYSIYSRKKINVKKTLLYVKRRDLNLPLDSILTLILKLKQIGMYKDAFVEANYYNRKAFTIRDKLRLHQVFPELTTREFYKKKYRDLKMYGFSFPRPFQYITNEDIVYAIMRQESLFYPYAVSRSNAIGLMQIMPKTGKWIAMKLGDTDFDVSDLFIPEINIKYGSWYIKYLIRRFNGNIFYAIASYNGGPGRVKKFIKKHKIRDIAEFIEFFPLQETRNYVKQVYINYIYYSE